MEGQTIDNLLDIVKKVLSSTPSVARDNSRVLPEKIPALSVSAASLPEHSVPLDRALEALSANVLPYLNASSLSSRYYGFITGGVTPAALVADILSTVYDQNLGVHLPKETISTDVEVAALNMLVSLFNLPQEEWSVGTDRSGGGVFTTGATASNILGLAIGREYVLSESARRISGKAMSVGESGLLAVSRAAQVDHVKILSTLPHSSIAKAASIVGFGRSSVVSIAKDGTDLTIDLDKLQSLAEDAEAERTAYIVAISAGEVNTGQFATDSANVMQRVRDICDKYGLWLHVDGAFGLFGRLLIGHPKASDYRQVINGTRGLELADSITSDGHKLLNVPYDCGIFFTRHKTLSESTCMNGGAAYLATGSDSAVQSPLNIGLENSRRFRALSVYVSLSTYGREGYCDMLIRQISLARRVAAWLWDHDEYDLLPSARTKEEALSKIFMIVLFRAKDTTKNEKLVQNIKDTGKIYVSGTSWEGKPGVRIAISNWRVDVEPDFEVIQEVLNSVL